MIGWEFRNRVHQVNESKEQQQRAFISSSEALVTMGDLPPETREPALSTPLNRFSLPCSASLPRLLTRPGARRRVQLDLDRSAVWR